MLYKKRLIDLRESKNLIHDDMAKILNIDKSVYGKYEREYIIIPIKHLNTLCNFFNVSFDYIFSLTNKKVYENKNNNIDKNLSGKRLKEFRKNNKLTQDKLAKILNISRTTITEYERGTNIIATPFLYTISLKYNISTDYLLGKINTPIYLKNYS